MSSDGSLFNLSRLIRTIMALVKLKSIYYPICIQIGTSFLSDTETARAYVDVCECASVGSGERGCSCHHNVAETYDRHHV